MKKIKYIVITIIFSILLGACSTIIGIYQVVTWKPKILVDLDIKAYSIYKDGKFTRDGFKENEIDKLSYKIVDDYICIMVGLEQEENIQRLYSMMI